MRLKMRVCLRLIASILGLAGAVGPVDAQMSADPTIALTTPSDSRQKLEVEVVEVHDRIALPSEIRRKAGPFVLMVVNAATDKTAWFVVDREPTTTNGSLNPAQTGRVLTLGSSQYERKHRAGGVVSAGPGTYQLKNGATGAVLAAIVIE